MHRPDADPARRSAALELVTAGLRLARKLGIDERLLAALRAAVREFTADAPPDDDRTAVIVKRVR